MLKSKLFLSLITVECCLLFFCYLHGEAWIFSDRLPELQAKRQLVRALGLTDLAIWTEARYTRHPSQADFFSAFQDFPGAIDHFPAGSIITPRQQGKGDAR
jgi:hypothetical protein